MDTTVNGSGSMAQDTTMVQSSTAAYANDQWASISPFSQSPYSTSPLNEYGTFGGYMHHGLPSESIARMPPPPPQSQTHHQLIQPAPPMAHHQLPMLNTQWPSQLTNPTPSGSYSAPPLSMTPASSLPSVEPPRLPAQHEKARKTLSAEQKRAMCQYHEENPGTRQADIGARFGVERSTVSKVLRHKDLYLKRDPEPENASGKRGKGKHPDFDRTLSNYVRRQQQRGFEVKDEEILEQAKLFAHAGGNQDSLLTTLTSSWLQKFKQKHGIGAGGRLMRRASETNIPDSMTMSTNVQAFSVDRKSSIISPVSPTQQLSPLSGSRSDEELHAERRDFDFPYGHTGSHSSTSLTSDLRDNSASFSGDTISPTGPFHFSPDPNVGAFPMTQNNLQLQSGPTDYSHREKRSNTFPSLNVDYVNQPGGTESVAQHQSSSTAVSSTIESPASEVQSTPFTLEAALTSPPTLRRSSSSSSIPARANNTPNADSSPITPTPEDARRAAQTLLNYLQSMSPKGQFDQSEYSVVVQLTKKLQIHPHQIGRPSIGGLSRIPEGDGEVQATEAVMEVR